MTITLILNTPATRLRARRINEHELAERTAREALERQTWCVRARHGGAVANSYGYPADTEVAVAVADPQGRTVVFMGRTRANKVTLAGAANQCLSGVRALFDDRISDEAKLEAARLVARRAALVEMVVHTAPGAVVAALGGREVIAQLSTDELEALLAQAS